MTGRLPWISFNSALAAQLCGQCISISSPSKSALYGLVTYLLDEIFFRREEENKISTMDQQQKNQQQLLKCMLIPSHTKTNKELTKMGCGGDTIPVLKPTGISKACNLFIYVQVY